MISGSRLIGKYPSTYLAIATACILTGCASEGFLPDLASTSISYELSAAEQELSCTRLNGRIQMRIIHLRHAASTSQPSSVSRALQDIANSLDDETEQSDVINEINARDVALIRAYNARLAELNCPTFDVSGELTNISSEELPTPAQFP